MPGPLGKVTKPLQAVFSKHNCVLSAVLRQDTEVGTFRLLLQISGE